MFLEKWISYTSMAHGAKKSRKDPCLSAAAVCSPDDVLTCAQRRNFKFPFSS